MSAIVQRTKNIARSYAKETVIDNYEETRSRLVEAVTLIEASISRGEAIIFIMKSEMENYEVIYNSYDLRVAALENLVLTPEGIDHKQINDLHQSGLTLRDTALRAKMLCKEKIAEINVDLDKMKTNRSELRTVMNKLDVAQRIVDGKEKLTRLSSYGGKEMQSSYQSDDIDLREASRLAKEAEALAEIKGWG